MAVMHVRIVGMAVAEGRMVVRMAVRLSRRVVRAMGVMVMVVVHMTVRMIENVVRVRVSVTFRQVQPCAECHQHTGDHDQRRQRLTKDCG